MVKKIIEKMIALPVIGELPRALLKAKVAGFYLLPPAKNFLRWFFYSREITNLTYGLTERNKLYLAALIAQVTRREISAIQNYFRELESDTLLRRHLQHGIRGSALRFWADEEIHYGRRIGWYAFVRALKPKVVVETGVDKGLGSCVLASALLRNAKEGHPGRYFGTDIDPQAGQLFSGRYAAAGEILYGDSIESLKKLKPKIDLFINDSDHSAEYEANEYRTIAGKLSRKGIILGDNAHATDKLFQFSRRQKRRFVFWGEKPRDHWYPGAGIGISYP